MTAARADEEVLLATSHPPVYTFVTDGVASAIEQAENAGRDAPDLPGNAVSRVAR